jgi:hypothetical protein
MQSRFQQYEERGGDLLLVQGDYYLPPRRVEEGKGLAGNCGSCASGTEKGLVDQ